MNTCGKHFYAKIKFSRNTSGACPGIRKGDWAGVTMTLFCTHGRVSGPSSLLDLRGHGPPRIQCPMSILTSGPETWPWGPVGWRRSSHDKVSRVPACESSPRAKLESDRY